MWTGYLAQDRDNCGAVAGGSSVAGHCLSSRGTVGFSRRTLLHGVSRSVTQIEVACF